MSTVEHLLSFSERNQLAFLAEGLIVDPQNGTHLIRGLCSTSEQSDVALFSLPKPLKSPLAYAKQ